MKIWSKSDTVAAVIVGAAVGIVGAGYYAFTQTGHAAVAAHQPSSVSHPLAEPHPATPAEIRAFDAVVRQAAGQTTLPYFVLSGAGSSAHVEGPYPGAQLVVPAIYRVQVNGNAVTETEAPGKIGYQVSLPASPSNTYAEWAQVEVVPHPLHASGFAAYTPLDEPALIDMNGQQISLALPAVAGPLHPEAGSGGNEPLPVAAQVRATAPILWTGVPGQFSESVSVAAGHTYGVSWPVSPQVPIYVTYVTSSPAAAQKLAEALAYRPGYLGASMAWETVSAQVAPAPGGGTRE
ncbi:hypothetical protein TPY_0424 [Sulfobacillus acidophilus TPY]|uniref:Uncharacterized protein n=1 Tax=Sulfobacillus acidophilus (strain ATCC 700253 / DSM 10332 / NAL) TaxID=679936 RepID=G8TY48_SULAD|nr:hypothetical protein TPY_0424 [Sulfobacillus acidophilus TPY]AEW03955.1 hypothetical protein Sulac_0388 [Sulfobacillus acidophilus DSM 10332]